ncbi:ABC transporter permease [Roseateles sp. SL47]|uniref:ABC transporter permease n=1 Tax=Roseateles sp. SL47 TaxID=2995138 RepID=UPI00226D7CA7|nr:ABC transporter permease [Roseateles sp. SL47]WAC73180.1 ABC transporter permease [Roseateles sp. SL47]
MIGFVRQVFPLLAMGLQTLPQRLGSSSVVVIGIAGVVAVLVTMLAVAAGLDNSLKGSGRNDNVLVMSSGSESEMGSAISREAFETIVSAPQVARDAQEQAIASAEIVTVFPAKFIDSMADGNVNLRGVGKQGLSIHSSIKVITGRIFQPGLREVVVGTGVARMFQGFKVGDQVRIGNGSWTVVGHYASGSIHDSEVLGDADTLQSALEMGTYVNAVYVRLVSPSQAASFREELLRSRNLHVVTHIESEYFDAQSKDLSEALRTAAHTIGLIMALGALFGAVHSLYISADARKVEMATLRAVGFRTDSITVAFMLEAALLSLIGGCLGAALAYALFNGYVASTINAGLSQLVFELSVSWRLVFTGIVWACVIGLLGALVPAVRAARQPVAVALRA